VNKDLIISRVVSGYISLQIHGQKYLLAAPSPKERYFSEEIYETVLREAETEGLLNNTGILNFLVKRKLWTEAQDDALFGLPKDIETFKRTMYENRLQSDKVEGIRVHLVKARTQWENLYKIRHSHDDLTCEGQATLAKGRYLIGCGLRTKSGKRLFKGETFWEDQSGILESAISAYSSVKLNESSLRQIARSDEWRSHWSMKKSGIPLFNSCVSNLTDEQRSLIGWSLLYDSIHEHSEAPSKSIIDDDDMLDGWLIIQREKSSKNDDKKDVEGIIKNERIKNSQEVFIMAGTAKDAKKIDALNDQLAARIKKNRMDHLKKVGQVSEWNMPDTKQEIQMQFNKMKGG